MTPTVRLSLNYCTSRLSGSSVACRRSSPSMNRFIKNPDSTHQDSNPTNVSTQAGPLVGDPRRLDGVDMRTRTGLRYRAIVEAILSEFPEIDPLALKELAGLRQAQE